MKKLVFVFVAIAALGSLSSCFQHHVCSTYTMNEVPTSNPDTEDLPQ